MQRLITVVGSLAIGAVVFVQNQVSEPDPTLAVGAWACSTASEKVSLQTRMIIAKDGSTRTTMVAQVEDDAGKPATITVAYTSTTRLDGRFMFQDVTDFRVTDVVINGARSGGDDHALIAAQLAPTQEERGYLIQTLSGAELKYRTKGATMACDRLTA